MNTKEAIEAVIREDVSGWGGELIGVDRAAEYIAGVIDEKCARIEQLEAELRDAYGDCLDAVNKIKTDGFTQMGAFRKIEYSTSTAKDFMIAMAEDIEREIKARATLGEK